MNLTLAAILTGLSILAIIWLTSKVKLMAFIALFIVSVTLAFATIPAEKVLSTLKEGFGATMASIGFLVIFGAIIGITLDRTGAMLSIANWILSKTGTRRSPLALALTGYITGLPIFCDSGFLILSGLARSFSRTSGIAMPFMASVLAISLYSVHCLIPPHPGATAAATIVGAGMGNMILFGMLLAIPGACAAFLWSRWLSRRIYLAEPGANRPPVSDQGNYPPVLLSLLPVVLPLLLITFKSIAMLADKTGSSLFCKIFEYPGEPVFALFAGVVLALLLLEKRDLRRYNSIFSEAVEKAGPVLIVTAAGGMFGLVIKLTGVGEAAGELLSGAGLGLLVPFIITAILKTAQGSSTVAIITSASLLTPILPSLGLDSQAGRMLALLSMGAGSMIASHANDSYFWIITNFSEIDPSSTLKIYSSSTIVMGLTVFALIYITSFFIL
jgi:GntP family gluconate:H+ symporter